MWESLIFSTNKFFFDLVPLWYKYKLFRHDVLWKLDYLFTLLVKTRRNEWRNFESSSNKWKRHLIAARMLHGQWIGTKVSLKRILSFNLLSYVHYVDWLKVNWTENHDHYNISHQRAKESDKKQRYR